MILNCFGKLFTSILNALLNEFRDAHTILQKNQAQQSIIFLYCMHKQKLQKPRKRNSSVRFIDLSKAFECVWRVGL